MSVAEDISGAVAVMREPEPPPRARLAPIAFNDVELIMKSPFIVKGIIPTEGLVVVWGPPKCGKSFWTFDLSMHVALGWAYRGRRVQQGAVVYVACEGAAGFRARIEAYRQHHALDRAALVPFYLVPSTLNLVEECGDLRAAIAATLGEVTPAVVVLDTLNRSLAGSENSDEDMSRYIKSCDAMREAFNCAVVVVHHCGTEGTRPRGHTSLTGAADAQIAVRRDDAGTVTAKVEWMKDGPEGDTICSRLDSIEVGTDEDGDPITSCVVMPEDDAGDSHRRPITGQPKIALDLLHRAIGDAGQIPPASNHIPRDMAVVPLSLWRRYCEDGQIAETDKPDTVRKAFVRSSRILQERQLVGKWGDFVWPIR